MKSTLIIAALVVLLASIFRITNPDLIEFKADEGINLFLSTRPIFGHPFPPGGTVSSLGVLNFPLMNYILFPIVSISADPRFIVLFIGLLNSIAIGALFLIFNRYHGMKIALISSILLALSPWAILFSRKIWAQDLVMPLTIPFILALHKILLEKKGNYWILYIISSLLLIQIYHSALFFIIPLSILLFLKRRPKIKHILLGSIIGIVPALPYFIYQLTNSCPDCTTFIAVKERLSPSFYPQIFIRPLQIMGRGNMQSIIGEDMVTFLREFPLIFQMQKVFYLEYVLLPLGFILFWKKYKEFRPLLRAIIILPVIYFVFRIEPFIHYFLITLPFLFLLTAFGIKWLLDNNRIILRSIGAFSLMLLIFASVLFNYAFLELVKKGNGLKGDYGRTYIKTREFHESMFANYKSDSHYQEMIITSYIPPNLLHGDIGIAKMIYSKEGIEKEMPQIEERLKKVPEDPRMHSKLIYYYTRTIPTKETIKLLEKKSKDIPGYFPIYSEVKNFYYTKN